MSIANIVSDIREATTHVDEIQSRLDAIAEFLEKTSSVGATDLVRLMIESDQPIQPIQPPPLAL